ncbi:MAG: penicillin-binding protein 1C [Balneolaceae bacterium]|nr:penicillin-binding protein 1C [Balneolaceae bacterium]
MGYFYWNSLPDPLFDTPYSTVLESANGELLGAKVADDSQWRFPISDSVPDKFKAAILEFEDRRFYEHLGVDVRAIFRAAKQNYESGRVVSGASTLTMQVIRLSQKNPERTVVQKLKEMMLATHLELSASKEEILSLYAAHAPFGGNVVGLETAAWRYFGREASQLSWAESATLAVLPNSPALIHPARNRDDLKAKRDRLLKRLLENDSIDSLTYRLSLMEALPDKPLPLPQVAPHYLAKQVQSNKKGTRIRSSIQLPIQQKVNEILNYHHQNLSANGIENAAIVVMDVKNQEVLSYVGNTQAGRAHDQFVNIIDAPRSSGSILKPLLYLLMLNEGQLLPNTLVPDVPSTFSEYSPKNFSRSYDGAVHASQVIARSLNVPSVRMLQEYGVPKFHHYLNEFGISTINNAPEHYGLTLVLGGAETTLWEISAVYASLANHLNTYDGSSDHAKAFSPLFVNENEAKNSSNIQLSAGAVWSTFEAMTDVQRPEDEVFWRRFDGARKVAWKTGTSFGNRDGWAIGVTPDYVVGVWVGNADGEGRPELTGVKTAGPILFDVYNALPSTEWFATPWFELDEIEVCTISGHRAGAYCEKTERQWVPDAGLKTQICPYHKLVHLNESETHQVTSKCADINQIKSESRFVLPADQEWYYQRRNASYVSLPPIAKNCGEDLSQPIQLIYPSTEADIFVPVELDGRTGKTVFEVAHRNPDATIFWHLNDDYLGETSHIHQMDLSPKSGRHRLVLIDEFGNRLERRFEIIPNKKRPGIHPKPSEGFVN